LVFSNSSTHQNIDWSHPPQIVATNIGCSQWSGTASGTITDDNGGVVTAQATVTYQRTPSSPDDPLTYSPVSGSGSWNAHGPDPQTADCGGHGDGTYSGSGTWSMQPGDGFLWIFWDAPTTALSNVRAYHLAVDTDGIYYPVTYTCGDGTSGDTVVLAPLWSTEAMASPQLVSPDGLSISGTDTQDDGNSTQNWTWNLTSPG
jgi:hypothetical protein